MREELEVSLKLVTSITYNLNKHTIWSVLKLCPKQWFQPINYLPSAPHQAILQVRSSKTHLLPREDPVTTPICLFLGPQSWMLSSIARISRNCRKGGRWPSGVLSSIFSNNQIHLKTTKTTIHNSRIDHLLHLLNPRV